MSRLCGLAFIHHAADRGVESDAALQALIANYSVDSAYQVAQVYAARDEKNLVSRGSMPN